MKKLITGLIASILLANSLPALAERHGRHFDRHFRADHHARHDHRHRHHGATLGILGAGLVLGALALSAEARQPPPAPVIIAPTRHAEGYWYYCGSVGAYYPYTQHCPEGWRAVSPTSTPY